MREAGQRLTRLSRTSAIPDSNAVAYGTFRLSVNVRYSRSILQSRRSVSGQLKSKSGRTRERHGGYGLYG